MSQSLFNRYTHINIFRLSAKQLSIKTYIDKVRYLLSSSWSEPWKANSFSISKNVILQFTNGLAYMMSSLCFEPLMSVNIQPLPYGSCTIVLNSTFCNFVKQSKKNLGEKTDDLLLFSKQTLVAKKQKGRRRESQKKN